MIRKKIKRELEIENAERLEQRGLDGRVVKFMHKFVKWANETDATEKAIAETRRYFARYKLNVSPLAVELRSVWGARVKLICFILEPR
jgi:hypothetical protein